MIRLALTLTLVAAVVVDARGLRRQARRPQVATPRLNQDGDLLGSCAGSTCSGVQTVIPGGTCMCDFLCETRDDCCDDFADECLIFSPPTCSGRCGGQDELGLCYCDALCVANNDCCSDFVAECATCEGACGCAAPSGTCFCNGETEPACSDYNATCADVVLPIGFEC